VLYIYSFSVDIQPTKRSEWTFNQQNGGRRVAVILCHDVSFGVRGGVAVADMTALNGLHETIPDDLCIFGHLSYSSLMYRYSLQFDIFLVNGR